MAFPWQQNSFFLETKFGLDTRRHFFSFDVMRLFIVASSFIFSGLLQAAVVVPTSYAHQTAPSGVYPDTGNAEMTNGITYSLAWAVPPIAINFGDVVNLSGWDSVNPVTQFNFDSTYQFNSVTVWAADSEGQAGVSLPSTITISTPSNSFSQTFNVTNPAGSGSTVALVFNGFSVTTNQLVITAQRNSQWTMFSEVQFNAIPEPSVSAFLGLLSVALLKRRRLR